MIRGPVRESAAVEAVAVTIRPNPPSEILAHPAMVWFPPCYAFIALTRERLACKRGLSREKCRKMCCAPIVGGFFGSAVVSTAAAGVSPAASTGRQQITRFAARSPPFNHPQPPAPNSCLTEPLGGS